MIRKGVLIACIAVFVSCFNRPTEGTGLSELGFYSTPDTIIETLEKGNPGYREHFMLGGAYRKKGNLKRAILHYSNGCFTGHRNLSLKLFPYPVYTFVTGMHVKSDLYDDAVFEIADLFYQYREFEYVVKFTKLLGSHTTALYRDAVILRSRALTDLNRDKEALDELKSILTEFDDTGSKMLVHLRRASIFEKSGAFPDAVKEYIQIFNLDETSWQAGIAASRTREIAAARSISLTEESRLALARALYSAARYSDALEMLKKLVQETGDKKVNRKGLEYLVKSCVRAGKIAEADRYIKQYADAAAPPYEWIKLKADEQWEGGRRGQAVAAYSMVREGAPEPLLRESRKRVALFMEERRAAGFEKILHEYRSSYPDDPASEYFTWALGKEALRRNDSTMAVSLFEEGLKKFPRGEYSDRCRFWLCKLYSSGGRKADGDAKFREMVVLNPESSYTWRLIEQRTGEHNPRDLKKSFADALAARDASGALFAHTMLFIQEKDVDKRDERIARMASHMREPYAALPRLLSESGLRSTYKSNLTKLKKYFVIGHLDGILKELGSLPSGQEIQKDKNIALSLYGEKYGLHYYMLLSTLEILREGGIPENVAMLPREALKRLLPMPFEACTVESASEFKVDVAAIYAVIKAESLFNHRAVSPAGAVGLMQLMPGTARGIARTIKVRPYDLKDPCTSVRFGAHYIAWLKKLYRGDFDYMIAGYNAGAGNVNRWRNERKADRDYFMEFIPFDETRYYVLRTGKFLYQYRLMHAAGH